jgi:drug/metabolite transporter (DMT)-like permease
MSNSNGEAHRAPVSPVTAISPTPTTPIVLVAFAAVYIIWGSTYLAIRVGVESFPPLMLAGARHLTFGLLLYPILRWKTGIRPTSAHWRSAIITGCLLLLLGNGIVCVAEQTVPSGVTALLVATVSLWMVLVDWLRPGGARPVLRVVLGLVVGFSGLLLLVGPRNLGGAGRVDPVGVALLVLASLAWACGSLYSKHGGMPSSPLLGASMQGLAGGLALWITSALTGELGKFHFAAVSSRSWLALAYLTFFGSMLGFSAYIYILKHSTATRVATYAFVNPVVALFLGWLILGEPLNLRTILAGAVILFAVVLVISAPRRHAPGPSQAVVSALEV